MFEKLVIVGPVNLVDWAKQELNNYAKEVVIYKDEPQNNEEKIERIKDADAVLVGYSTLLPKEVLAHAPNLKYVGMICSLYSEESANVDIAYAKTRGIVVKGVRGYGDKGVAEYVIYQLVRLLHGYDCPAWAGTSREITDLNVGMVGIGENGSVIADALHFFGANVNYYARSVKPEKEERGMHYKPLHELLETSDVVFTCLNKNVILLHKEEFEKLGNGKIMFNTSIGPAADMDALEAWIQTPGNIFCCDMNESLGNMSEEIRNRDNVICMGASSGMTQQAYDLLSQKSLNNIKEQMGTGSNCPKGE